MHNVIVTLLKSSKEIDTKLGLELAGYTVASELNRRLGDVKAGVTFVFTANHVHRNRKCFRNIRPPKCRI